LETVNTDYERGIRDYLADERLAAHIHDMQAAFPGYQLTPEDMIAEGDKVAVRFMFRGTHRGPFAGIAPTGRAVSMPGIIIYRVANERIVEHWLQIDTPALLQQLQGRASTEPASA
jgi:predicted ester cyclase